MPASIRQRVRNAAQTVLDRDKSVGPIELLVEIGFLHFSHVRQWKFGNPRFATLEPHIQCGEKKQQQTWTEFLAWVRENNLEPFSAEYSRASRSGTQPLTVTDSGDEEQEAFFCTHFRRSDLSDKQKQRIETKKSKKPDLVAFQMTSKSTDCSECNLELETDELFVLEEDQPLCLDCADLGHLEFLPSGDATLTRRARKHSPLSVIVTRFNKRRRRYERQGVLVTAESIDQTYAQNASDEQQRKVARQRAALRRSKQDAALVKEMTEMILQKYPGCDPQEANRIAAHTAERGSGRVGRSAAGRKLDPQAIGLAVAAWVRHQHTEYDELLMSGVDRQSARDQIRHVQRDVLSAWSGG